MKTTSHDLALADIEKVRDAVKADTRASVDIATAAGMPASVLSLFRTGRTGKLSYPALKALVPVVLPGRILAIVDAPKATGGDAEWPPASSPAR
jgi:hypothetical protein